MKIIYLGGANEVGASSILVNVNGKNILFDAGIRQNKNKDKLPDFSTVMFHGGIDAIVVSHAHMDHTGSLPIISKEYPDAKIYMTGMTLDLIRVLLYDSLKIMGYTEGEIPIFNEKDVLNMLDRVRIVPFEKEIQLLDDIKMTFYMAGHIGGAACTYLKTKEGSLLYTGDFSLTVTHTISGMSIPKLRPDVVISETTYGDKLHSNREAEEMRLIEKVKETLENGGKVLIPVFALGRSQEVQLILKRAISKHQLGEVPIYIDGMVQNINAVFQNNPLYLKESLGKKILREKDIFYNDYTQRVESDAMRTKITEDSTPCIIISSSGMLVGGRSEFYASKLVSNEQNSIILTGYQDEESNGRLLLNLLEEEPSKRKITLASKVYEVKCNVDIVGLSAHADKQEIKSVLSMLSPKYVILGHGDKEVIDIFAKEISEELPARIYAPNIQEEINIEVRNPRKQIDKKLEHIFAERGTLEDFYNFLKIHYGTKLFTIEDLGYIYFGREASEEELMVLTKELIASIYFTQDSRRYFLFKIALEEEIEKALNREVTNQELEDMLTLAIKDFPYKKISYYRNEKRIVVNFDFPRVIGQEFDEVCDKFLKETGYQVVKNDNINNLACENVIRETLGRENIDKISYMPLLDKFVVKVYEDSSRKEEIEKIIGYDVDLVIVPKKAMNFQVVNKGEKMEQNAARCYIESCFDTKEHKPYKISLKNGSLVLSFITYEIGLLYMEDIKRLEEDTGYSIELNRSANMTEIFSVLNSLLSENGIVKLKNPSFLPDANKVSIKIEKTDEELVEQLKKLFYKYVGLELLVEM